MNRGVRGLAALTCAAVVGAGGLATAGVAGATDNGAALGGPTRGGAAPAADVLLSGGRPVTASSTSSCCATANAVDGKVATRGASQAGKDPQWIYVDLGAAATVSRVRLQWDRSCASAYELQTSADARDWTRIFA